MILQRLIDWWRGRKPLPTNKELTPEVMLQRERDWSNRPDATRREPSYKRSSSDDPLSTVMPAVILGGSTGHTKHVCPPSSGHGHGSSDGGPSSSDGGSGGGDGGSS